MNAIKINKYLTDAYIFRDIDYSNLGRMDEAVVDPYMIEFADDW